MSLGKWIQNERKKRYPSQKKFAEALNVSQGSVSLWENNKTVPSVLTLQAIVQDFNMSLLYTPLDNEILSENRETLNFYEFDNEQLVTVEGKVNRLKGFIGITLTSNEIEVMKAKGAINCWVMN